MKVSRDIGDSILEQVDQHCNLLRRIVLLSGGVGGARMARGLASVVAGEALAVVVNVGDDQSFYGVPVSPDIDTVLYTMAGVEGPQGWGVANDTFVAMDELASRGTDTRFRIGDRDLRSSERRKVAFEEGRTLSEVTADMAADLGIAADILPATDDDLRTWVLTEGGERISFQDYFVLRGQRDEVAALDFAGAASSHPAPGVLDAILGADIVIIAPSNPPLSVWPILAIPGIRDAVSKASRVVAISPLFGGKALKGPADRVMASLGLPAGTEGVLRAYDGLLTDLVVDQADAADVSLAGNGVSIAAVDTRIADPAAGAAFAAWLMGSA